MNTKIKCRLLKILLDARRVYFVYQLPSVINNWWETPRKLSNISLTLVLLNPDMPCLCKQCRSISVGFWRSHSEANWYGSALFAVHYVNSYQQSGPRNLTGWQLEVGVASKFIQQDKGLVVVLDLILVNGSTLRLSAIFHKGDSFCGLLHVWLLVIKQVTYGNFAPLFNCKKD